MIPLDPHWNWVNVQALGDPAPVYIRCECLHLETVPVTLLITGELVAEICITCEAQLSAP